jgi:hypothetical protein
MSLYIKIKRLYMAEINLKNILQFAEGNVNMFIDKLNLLPKHKREQVMWRLEICKDDCVIKGRCKYCGCSVPGKLYVDRSCNSGERFPDMMEELEWEEFKKNNNLTIN